MECIKESSRRYSVCVYYDNIWLPVCENKSLSNITPTNFIGRFHILKTIITVPMVQMQNCSPVDECLYISLLGSSKQKCFRFKPSINIFPFMRGILGLT